VIAEGNYGQTEGVFLCLLSFARAKKVRRLPAATGITAIGDKSLSIQHSLGLKMREKCKQRGYSCQRKAIKPNPGVAPPAVALLFLLAQNE